MTRAERRQAADAFVSRLERLSDPKREDRAALARLKRCAGRSLGESREALPLFYGHLLSGVQPPPRGERQEEALFLIATLFPLAPGRRHKPEETGTGTEAADEQKPKRSASHDLGRSLRLLTRQEGVNPDGVDRRLTVLLDADREELPFRLRQAVRMLGQKEVAVDWRELVDHLLAWDDPQRWVQKQWARSYFGLAMEEPGAESETAGGADGETTGGTTEETETHDAD